MANILVIGNGFDLYHGKKTSYSDFLDFLIDYKDNQCGRDEELTAAIQPLYESYCCVEPESSLENYLLAVYRSNRQKQNWINLEKDIKEYVHRITSFLELKDHVPSEDFSSFRDSLSPINLTKDHRILVTSSDSLFDVNGKFHAKLRTEYIDPLGFVNIDKVYLRLEKELSCLSQVLTYYLETYEPAVRNIEPVPQDFLAQISPIRIISFNYTSTPTDLYNYNIDNVRYVHGSLNSNNIVLGYDDIDGGTDDLIFKKYYRRLVKDTDYLQGKDLVQRDMGFVSAQEIYLFGHSLDLSDEDFLKVIFDRAGRVHVFYLDELDRANKIANIIKLLDKDTAIKRIVENKIVFVKIPEYVS